jgi:P63C domain
LIALIDEATGYQYERAEDALQVKLRAFIADELRAWEKTFPDELWEEFGRLPSVTDDNDLLEAATKLAWKPEDEKEAAN